MLLLGVGYLRIAEGEPLGATTTDGLDHRLANVRILSTPGHTQATPRIQEGYKI